ncbi:SecE-domain-containing protein [Gonapodya prolifera JEL478]|uniref:SecE-domain-containing protein n=1 Tax=Gonapodya prolifera (strain JEL478) TaxID=1344416 RepID=A0A139ABC7_GONPJ|nr:SecE-domain-containing protein [Gonapodya prolifera JEL478]|eukprot:KXS14018.1 SecE-domain-containing protein [Gonapodya prolifera JEL478]
MSSKDADSNDLLDGPRQFFKESQMFINRCKKPDRKEFLKISQAIGMGFLLMGAIGYFIKLIHIPIINIIVGAS